MDIIDFMAKTGISGRCLARATNIPPQTMSRIIRRDGAMTLLNYVKLCKSIGVCLDPEDLLNSGELLEVDAVVSAEELWYGERKRKLSRYRRRAPEMEID